MTLLFFSFNGLGKYIKRIKKTTSYYITDYTNNKFTVSDKYVWIFFTAPSSWRSDRNVKVIFSENKLLKGFVVQSLFSS